MGQIMKKKPLIVIPIATLLVAATVFGVLWFTRERPDYAGALSYVSEILKTKDTITTFISSADNFDLENLPTTALDGFKSAAAQVTSYYESLSASTAMRDENVKERYSNLEDLPKTLTKILDTQALLTNFIEKTATSGYASASNELAALKSSSITFISTLGADLDAYFAQVAAFSEKYQNAKSDQYDAMLQAQVALAAAGKDLETKYANASFEDIFDVAPTTIKDHFDQLKNFESYLKEKS